MYKQSWGRCTKGGKDLPNNKCHEIPCETLNTIGRGFIDTGHNEIDLFLFGKSFVKITSQNSISKRMCNIHCWAIRAPTLSHGRDAAPDSFTLSQSNVLSYRLRCLLFRYSFQLIPYNIQAFNK